MFDPSRLHVTFAGEAGPAGPLFPRRYTLTHSDRTGELFLTIGTGYDQRALRALQVRLERDEVLGEWVLSDEKPRLELHMAAQGGLPLFGTGRMRCDIFRSYRPLVLGALCHGDGELIRGNPELDEADVVACFAWRRGRSTRESWGRLGDYRRKRPSR